MDYMVDEIKQSKYFSIILDCIPDLNHREQLSVVVRFVSVEDTPQIKEHIMWFLEAEETTGESLSIIIQKKLGELNLSFEDCRGQS